MRRRSTGWLGTLPLLVFYAFVFGIPLAALLVGAFTSRGEPTLANMRQSLEGGNLTAMAGSVQVSAVVALLGAVLGTVFAYAVVTSRSTALRNAVLTASGVLANFGGVPLAFFWVATLGNSGVVSG
ncbi:MAG TPA: ABC transporter permease, partial [Nonomuraea sp.]|nr:ABC transporter permease [Nonomuraea sp.]